MQIAGLHIENFRGIRSGQIRFGQHTIFVGPNNCGKTTIIEALALLFGRDRMVRTLTEHDFFGGDPQPTDRMRLTATIVGFNGDNSADYPEWFREDRGVPKWWNPDNGAVTPTRTAQSCRLACQIGFCARFDRSELEVETLRYFHDDCAIGDLFVSESAVVVPNRLIQEIGFFLVPANRTWDRVVSFGSELFRRVVASAAGQPAESVLAERDRLRTPAQPLEADQHLAPIVTLLNAELAGFFRGAPTLQLRITTTDSSGLLEAVVPHYAEGGTPALPARRCGSGLISLQHLLLLLQFGRQRSQADEGFWMALEEPELHVPPPLQRRLVHRIQALSTQTFVSTHSPLVAAMADPKSVVVLRNEAGALSAKQFLTAALPSAAPNSVRKLFQLNRVDTIAALMHDVVLIPEGRIDFEWLKLLVRAVDLNQGWMDADESRFGAYVGLIPTQDAAVEATVEALLKIHPFVAALVDGDSAGQGYAQALVDTTPGPALVIRWPNNWTVEDVVGWILDADPAQALPCVASSIAPEPPSTAALVARLKSQDRSHGGLKQDQVAYEAVAGVIGTVEPCCLRARGVLNGLTDALLGAATPRFTTDQQGDPRVKVFRP